MRFAGHAFVDWDDTIAENIRYFHQAATDLATHIARLTGADFARVKERGEELDLATVRRLGLVKDSLAIAWTDCYREFCASAEMAADPQEERAIQMIATGPYEAQQEIRPGAPETLKWLRENGFEITIWTAGDQDVQGRKIRRSGLHHLVHREQIVIDKTPDRLHLAMGDRDPRRCFVVGNSLHSDIRPALTLGLLAFHVPAETWAYDHSRVDLTDPNYHRIAGIHDLPGALTGRFRFAG